MIYQIFPFSRDGFSINSFTVTLLGAVGICFFLSVICLLFDGWWATGQAADRSLKLLALNPEYRIFGLSLISVLMDPLVKSFFEKLQQWTSMILILPSHSATFSGHSKINPWKISLYHIL